MKGSKKIVIIIPYFGQWPGWMDFFLLSCSFNQGLDWLMFSDCPIPVTHPENVRFVPFTLHDFNLLASRKTGIQIEIRHPYKICDLKPAYGDIFEEYISEYAFWGYGDLDLVYGNIMDFFPDNELHKFDVISNHTDFVTGHLCLLRNTPEIRNLYRKGNAYHKAFSSRSYTGFDEQLKALALRPDPGYLYPMKRLDLTWHIFVTSLRDILRKSGPLKGLNRKRSDPKEMLNDFTSIVRNAMAVNGIRAHFKKTFQSDLMLRKRGERNWSIKWVKGNLFNEQDKRKLLYFHFILSKSRRSFRITEFKPDMKEFTISKTGISE